MTATARVRSLFFKKRLLEGALSFLLLGYFLNQLILPLLKIESDLRAKIKLFEYRFDVGQKYLSLIKKESQARLLYQKRDRVDTTEVLASLESLALQTGVVISGIRPKETAKSGSGSRTYTTIPLDLEIYAKEGSLARFIAGLGSLDFLCRVVQLTIAPDTKSDKGVIGQLRLEKIDSLPLHGPLEQKTLFGVLPETFKRQKEYLSLAAQRQLFKTPLAARPKNVQISLIGENDFIKNFSLVGIIEDGTSKAVVEDKRSGKTYFLNVQDSLGDFKVTQIKQGELLLEASGVSYTLTM